jgi:hypothetical protein
MTKQKLVIILRDTKSLLEDLKRCCAFYPGAIEIDSYIDNAIDGEQFEERIDQLLKTLNKENI